MSAIIAAVALAVSLVNLILVWQLNDIAHEYVTTSRTK